MIINRSNLAGLTTSFSAAFQGALNAAPPMDYAPITFVAPSSTARNAYPFLGQVPGVKEWIGERAVRNLTQHDYSIENRKFEDTVSVKREDIEDDQYGVYTPMFSAMGAAVAAHPNELVFETLSSGHQALCYDGQYFFDADHPVKQADGSIASVSNIQTGGGTPWYLIDATKAMKPIILQNRIAPTLVRKDREDDDNVFERDEFVYGVRLRRAAGFGYWQTAFRSEAPLNAENFKNARAAMHAIRGDEGRPLNIMPTHLVIPPSLEAEALELLNSDRNAAGATNIWRNKATLLMTTWLQ